MIAILTENKILARMLTLEVERHGFSLTPPDRASILLVDFDCPPKHVPAPKEGVALIGFSSDSQKKLRADLLLPLPYPSKALGDALCRFALAKQNSTESATMGQKNPHLSPAEEKIFRLLLERQGQTVTKEELLALLPESEANSNVLTVHIYRLRQKLSGEGASYIRAVRGIGYRLCSPQGNTEK